MWGWQQRRLRMAAAAGAAVSRAVVAVMRLEPRAAGEAAAAEGQGRPWRRLQAAVVGRLQRSQCSSWMEGHW